MVAFIGPGPGRGHLEVSVNRHQKRSEDSGWGSPIFRSEEKETPVNAEKEQNKENGVAQAK